MSNIFPAPPAPSSPPGSPTDSRPATGHGDPTVAATASAPDQDLHGAPGTGPYPGAAARSVRPPTTFVGVPHQAPYRGTDPVQASGYDTPFGGQQRPRADRRAIAALVVGAVSFVLSVIPLVNVVAVVGGVVGAVLAVVALRRLVPGVVVGKGMAIAGLALSGLAVVLAILINVIVGVAFVDAGVTVQDIVEEADEQSASSAAAGEPVPGVPGEESADAGDATGEPDLFLLGEPAQVGDYTVTVTAVDTDATEQILDVDPSNEPPAGQYVRVDVAVVYTGSGEGNPYDELMLAYIGADARLYDETTCNAWTAKPGSDLRALAPATAADYQVCMDVPVEALANGAVYVQDMLSDVESGAIWAIL